MKRVLICLAGVLAFAACDEAALSGGSDFEPIPDGFKRARNPLPDAVITAIVTYKLPVESIITKDGCYYTHIEPDRPDLVSPLRTAEGAQICTA